MPGAGAAPKLLQMVAFADEPTQLSTKKAAFADASPSPPPTETKKKPGGRMVSKRIRNVVRMKGTGAMFSSKVETKARLAPRKSSIAPQGGHEMEEGDWSPWTYVFLMFTSGSGELEPRDLLLMLESRSCPCTGVEAKTVGRAMTHSAKDASPDKDQWLRAMRKIMNPDGTGIGQVQRIGGHNVSRFVGSLRAYNATGSAWGTLKAFFMYLCFPVIYLGLSNSRFSSVLYFSYRYLLPPFMHVERFDARGCFTLLCITIVWLVELSAVGLFVYICTRQQDGVDALGPFATFAEVRDVAAESYAYYGQALSEGVYPMVLLLFSALVASIAFVRQQRGRHNAWETAARVGRLTHVVVRETTSYGEEPSFRIIDGVNLYYDVVETSNKKYLEGQGRRGMLKFLAFIGIGTPTAFLSMLVRYVSGYPISGGAGYFPVLMTCAHVMSLYLVVGLFVEAAARSFDLLHLLSCRAKTLGEIKCTDDAEERAAQKADTLSLDLRTAEGCIAWAKLREYMLEERQIDVTLVETSFLACGLLIAGHGICLMCVILSAQIYNTGDGGGLPIGSLVLTFSSLWAMVACGGFMALLLTSIVNLNAVVHDHVEMLKAVRDSPNARTSLHCPHPILPPFVSGPMGGDLPPLRNQDCGRRAARFPSDGRRLRQPACARPKEARAVQGGAQMGRLCPRSRDPIKRDHG